MKGSRMARGAGILLAVTSLPSPYGIGTMGKEAFRFVDTLAEILAGASHRPYQFWRQPLSVFLRICRKSLSD